jgi:hypothetical protein
MREPVVGNRDRCGRCGAHHGGNSHSCPVHGAVSAGCCESMCNPAEWEFVYGKGPQRKSAVQSTAPVQ